LQHLNARRLMTFCWPSSADSASCSSGSAPGGNGVSWLTDGYPAATGCPVCSAKQAVQLSQLGHLSICCCSAQDTGAWGAVPRFVQEESGLPAVVRHQGCPGPLVAGHRCPAIRCRSRLPQQCQILLLTPQRLAQTGGAAQDMRSTTPQPSSEHSQGDCGKL
jgi:hypothetical protein